MDYGEPVMPSSQRRFLMQHYMSVVPDHPGFPTLAAEELAADYLEAGETIPKVSYLQLTSLPNVWRLWSSGENIVALFRGERIADHMQSLINSELALTGAKVKLLSALQEQAGDDVFLSVSASEHLPDWQLALYLEGPDPFAAASERQIAAYIWTGVLGIVLIAIAALLVGRHLVRQVKLTRLKNDFIATVSHELKTPLSSMRVLVDTLVEGHYRDQQQVREYLQLIAGENKRLTHLIDNFLTFSRMERNKRAFEFADIDPGEVATAAAELVRNRFAAHGCEFDVDIAPKLPEIAGDRDALVTVLLNLLDNACKYSENNKQISLRAYESNGNVLFEVRDNGIGLSRRAARKIFDRFYQVDRSLSRNAGGCGLGLSIVKFIVEAHRGSVSVKSELGTGSTFTVKLPAAGAANVTKS